MTGRAHSARIYWSQEHIRNGLPKRDRTVDPAWFNDRWPPTEEGWSLICNFKVPPSEQGDPSVAEVHFLVDGAPHDRLTPGTWLWMFERATRQRARVEIVD